jgi:hypothetical protein
MLNPEEDSNMKVPAYLVLAVASISLAGLTACGTPQTVSATQPTGAQAASAPHYSVQNYGIGGFGRGMGIGTPGVSSMSNIINNLPQSVSLEDSQRTMLNIDPNQITPINQTQLATTYGTGLGRGMGFGQLGNNAWGIAPTSTLGNGLISDYGNIGTGYSTALATAGRAGLISYLNQGNMYFPYQQTGNCMTPYVVDRKVTPFFVENTTVAIPKVTQVAQEISVPRQVTLEREVTVQQPVQIPKQVSVTVYEQGTVPVQTTVPYCATVFEKQTVFTPRVDQVYAQSSTLRGPSGNVVPLTYDPNGNIQALTADMSKVD